MKIKCPSCTTSGRVPDGKIPASGANIRCPSCSFVFFVGGPEATNVVPESEMQPVSAQPEVVAQVTSSIPSDIVARVRASAQEAVEAQRTTNNDNAASSAAATGRAEASPPSPPVNESPSEAPSDPGASGFGRRGHVTPISTRVASGRESASSASVPDAGGFSGYGVAATPIRATPSSMGDAGAAQAPPAAVTTAPPADPSSSSMGVLLGGSSVGRARAATGSVRSIAEATAASAPHPTLPPVETRPLEVPTLPVDPNASSTVPGLGDSPRARRTVAWKVRNNLGITYDFPDLANVRRWLEGRATHDELSVSNDGGASWNAPSAVPDVADVRPSGLRSTQSTESIRAIRQTGSIRSVGSTGAVPSVGEAAPRPDNGAPSGAFETQRANDPAASTASQPAAPASSAVDAASSLTERMASAARGVNAHVRRETPSESSSSEPNAADEKRKRSRRLKILSGLAVAAAILAGASQFVVQRQEPGLEIPNTPAGRQMRWILTTIEGGTDTLSDAAVEERFAPSVLERVPVHTLRQQLEYYDSWREDYRPLRFARAPSPTLLEITVLTNGGDTGVIRVETEPNPPHRLVSLNFRGAD